MKQNRLSVMEQYVRQKGTCSIDELCAHFGVSKITVRRDITALEERGSLRKIYGGVASVGASPRLGEAGEQADAKRHVAALAATRIEDGDTLFFDTGTTVSRILPYISDRRNLTIVTNSLHVLTGALANADFNVICLGGKLQHESAALAGATQGSFYCKKAFISAESVSPEHGVGNSNFYDGVTKRIAIESSDVRYLLVTADKFSAQSFNSFAKLKEFSALLCDRRPPESVVSYCDSNQIEVQYE